MEILTEFDELQAALAKVNMDESVMPYINGRLVSDEAFNKTQKILNCPEMISAHKYLYELDMDQLSEEDEDKINQLYKLGCDRGFIIDDLTKWDDEGNEEEEITAVEEVPEAPVKPQNTLFKAKVPCWTVIYSATKDGDIKTGEAYSNAVSMSAAKADVNAKLSQCGYDNITILAIENCPDMPKATAVQDYGTLDVSEADDKKDDSSSDDKKDDSSSDDSSSDDGDDSDDDSFDEEPADDSSDEDTSDDDSEDADSEDGSDDSNDDSDEDSSEDDSDEDDDKSDEDSDDELDANKKSELRNLYRKTFKNTLVKCKFDTSFNDLTLDQKVKFFTELSKAWNEDYDPNEFMTDKELEQLDNVVADVDASDDSSDDDSDDSSDDE